MGEGSIPVEQIGIVQNISNQDSKVNFGAAAHTLKHKNTLTIEVKYRDGTVDTIQSTNFIKTLDKNPSHVDPATPPADHYLAMVQLLVDAGVPVAPTVKSDDNKVAVADISEGGVFFDKALFGKVNKIFTSKPRLEGNIESYKHFLELPLDELKNEAQKLIDMANRHDLFLPDDDMFNLLVLPDGRWRLLVLDPMYLRQYDREKGSYVMTAKHEQTGGIEPPPEELNGEYLDLAIDMLSDLKKDIRELIDQQ